MPTVLRIDSFNPSDPIVIKAGTSLRDLLDDWGATFSVEHVAAMPPGPRQFSPEAKQFLRDFEREDSASVLAVFWRYGVVDAEEFDSVEEAERFLENGAEYGSLAGEAIVAGDEIRVLP